MKPWSVLGAFVAALSVAAVAATAFAHARRIELAVTEKGFDPGTVKVKKGEPVELVITRKTDKTCATELVIDEHKIKVALPLNKPVTVSFTPDKSGALKYGCGMNKMIGGVLLVE